METIAVSQLLRYGSGYHGEFEKVSEGHTILITRRGRPHVVLAPGSLAETVSAFQKAERHFNRMNFDERAGAIAGLMACGGGNNLQAFIQQLASGKKKVPKKKK